MKIIFLSFLEETLLIWCVYVWCHDICHYGFALYAMSMSYFSPFLIYCMKQLKCRYNMRSNKTIILADKYCI